MQLNIDNNMNKTLLDPAKDPMGAAILDFYNTKKSDRLRVFSSQFDEDRIPVRTLFRSQKQMSIIEQTALDMAEGEILDVGGGSGCHSLVLQRQKKNVTTIDISTLSVEVMTKRGVKSAKAINLFDPDFNQKFDTILLLMNGSGIIGKIENMGAFFARMKELLNPGGSILMDSSDLSYLYEEEDHSIVIDIAGDYYGEIDYQMQYKDVMGDSFDWLYVDFNTLELYANQNGFNAQLIKEGLHYDYLAKLSLIK